jgi:hypothetical protein
VRAAVERLAFGFAAGGLAAVLLVLPRFDAVKSARPLSAEILARVPPHEPYAIWPRFDAPFVFYTGRFAVELEGEGELAAYAARQDRVWLVAERGALAQLSSPLPFVAVAGGTDVGPRSYLLLTNRPDDVPAAPREPTK